MIIKMVVMMVVVTVTKYLYQHEVINTIHYILKLGCMTECLCKFYFMVYSVTSGIKNTI